MNRIHNGIGRYTPIRTQLLFAGLTLAVLVLIFLGVVL